MKKLTKLEDSVLKTFKRLAKKQNPTNQEMADDMGYAGETIRTTLHNLAKKRYIKFNKKLTRRKFSLK